MTQLELFPEVKTIQILNPEWNNECYEIAEDIIDPNTQIKLSTEGMQITDHVLLTLSKWGIDSIAVRRMELW
jgi:hypothetical protein